MIKIIIKIRILKLKKKQIKKMKKFKKNIHFTLIAAEGLAVNENSSVVQKVITLYDLFRES